MVQHLLPILGHEDILVKTLHGNRIKFLLVGSHNIVYKSANLAGFGSPEAQFCLHSNLSLEQLCQTTLEDFGKLELLEKIFGLLQINHVTPLGFSQQFEAQQSLPEKVFYVEGCRRCCFIFNATLRAHQEEWISVEIVVCLPQVLDQVRQALPCSPAAAPWLALLQAIAEDPTESLRGLLGHLSSIQMDLIESLFVSIGEPDPWGSIINPIWAAHLVDVEEAWDRAPESSPDLTSGESPQWGFASFALTGAVLTGLSGRDRQVDRNPK